MDNQEEENNLLIYPLFKKSNSNIDFSENEVLKENIDKLIEHYIYQIVGNLQNHNLPMDNSFNRDIGFVFESIKSAVYRSLGEYHALQEYIDHIHDLDAKQNSNDEEEQE